MPFFLLHAARDAVLVLRVVWCDCCMAVFGCVVVVLWCGGFSSSDALHCFLFFDCQCFCWLSGLGFSRAFDQFFVDFLWRV